MHTKTSEQISRNMRAVKCKNSEIELMLRRELWNRGLRYRKNAGKIFGKPDIAFLGKRVAVFCDSEFWHGYDWGRKNLEFKTKRDFWIPKIERNMNRDLEVTAKLESEGWVVLRFWGKEIKNNCSGCADIIENTLRSR